MYKFPHESTLITVTNLPVHLVKAVASPFSRDELTRYIELIRRQRYTFNNGAMVALDPTQYTITQLRDLAKQLAVDLKKASLKKGDAIHIIMNRIGEIRGFAHDFDDTRLLGTRD